MKSPRASLFGGKGEATLRAIGFLALIATSIFCLCLAQTVRDESSAPAAPATPSYQIVDLGTLGGATSLAVGMAGQQGHNAAGMIVGGSSAADNSEHAFLYFKEQMYDLNDLCDLSTSDFRVLTVARAVDDAGQIIGEGLTSDNQKHAFLLKPTLVDGGNWSYDCCQWVWKQGGGDIVTPGEAQTAAVSGWWWESASHSYKWHGGPGKHASAPNDPPHCWNWPLPCPLSTGSQPYPHPCWCCLNGQVVQVNDSNECSAKGGQCFPTQKAAETYCRKKICWCCFGKSAGKNGTVAQLSDLECRKRGGQCYETEHNADLNCQAQPAPPLGADVLKKKKCWCCHNGVVSEITQPDCIAIGGACYASEADAKKACWGFCCVNSPYNAVYLMTMAECEVEGGKFYPDNHLAVENCGPSCWCCTHYAGEDADLKVILLPRPECIQSGGQCYETQAAAVAKCPGAKLVPFLKGPAPSPSKQPAPVGPPPAPPPPPQPAPIRTPAPQVTPVPNNPKIPLSRTTAPQPQVTPNIYHRPSRGPRRSQIAPATPPPPPGTSSRSPTSTRSVRRRFPVKGLTTPPTPTPPVIR